MKPLGLTQNNQTRVIDQHDRGLITADDANVQMVRDERYRLIRCRVTRSVRTALNAAVKSGQLGHLKKDGLIPEAYFHPTFKYLAVAERKRVAQEGIKALLKICI